MNACLACCVVRKNTLRRADPSSRESYRLWRVVVCDIKPQSEAALAIVGLLCQRKKKWL